MNKKTVIRILSVLIILVTGFIGMQILGSNDKSSNKKDSTPEIRIVETQTLQFGDRVLRIKGNGIIEPGRTLNVVSEAAGIVLFAKNNLKTGTYLKKEEIIIKIDDKEIRNSIYSARSDFLNTVASILPELKVENQEIYNKWYLYFQDLDIYKSIPDLPVTTNSQEKIKVSGRNIFSKFYNLKNQEILLSKYTIRAPFEGFITSNGVMEKSYISRGQNLFTLNDVSNSEIAVPLLISDYNKINFLSSPPIKIISEHNNSFLKGSLLRKDAKLDRNSQTINIYIKFQNQRMLPEFLPGNYVDIEIEGKLLKDVTAIPRYSLHDLNKIYILKEGRLNQLTVEVVAIEENEAILKNTIPAGTKLVTTILQKPLIGMEIQSSNEPPIQEINL